MSDPIEKAAISELREHTGAVREMTATVREGIATAREGIATVREMPSLVGQEVRSTTDHLGVVGFGGSGLLMILWFLLKLLIWWLTKK